jgi:flavin-binding protein dodecin
VPAIHAPKQLFGRDARSPSQEILSSGLGETDGNSQVTGGDEMHNFKTMEIVAVSRESFSAGIKRAVQEAQRTLGDRLESVEIGPPWNIVLTKDKSVEFRNTLRLIYRSEE